MILQPIIPGTGVRSIPQRPLPFARRAFPGSGQQRAGFILVAVLVIVMLASMVAISLLFRLKAESVATSSSAGTEQAYATAMTGIEEAIRQIAGAAPGTIDWQDHPAVFRDQFVYDDGTERWYFTLCSPATDDALHDLRYGLTDEASKLNLNASHTTNLLHLPHMTPALVAAVRDFIDFDDLPRPEGAEQDYYDGLPYPYAIRNAPLETLDELLLVRGFTPLLLYGEDANMNWRLDPNEADGNERFPPDNNDNKLDLGLRQYFTVASYDPNEDNDGVPRTNINDSSDKLPGVPFPKALVAFVNAMRANKIRLRHPADLLEAKIKIKDNRGRPVELESGVGKEELPQVLDLFTCSNEDRTDGLINVNTASIRVLQTVPGIDEPLAEAIVSTRRSISAERRATLAWLYQEGVVNAALFKQIAPFLAARSFQYTFHVVGYGMPSGRYRVLDVQIDLAHGKPRIRYLRDITKLGVPFKLERKELTDA